MSMIRTALPHALTDWQAEADAGRLLLAVLDLEGCGDKASLMQRVAGSLELPPSFGANWDALTDAFRDLGADGQTVIVAVRHDGALAKRAPESWETLWAVLIAVGDEALPGKFTAFRIVPEAP